MPSKIYKTDDRETAVSIHLPLEDEDEMYELYHTQTMEVPLVILCQMYTLVSRSSSVPSCLNRIRKNANGHQYPGSAHINYSSGQTEALEPVY